MHHFPSLPFPVVFSPLLLLSDFLVLQWKLCYAVSVTCNSTLLPSPSTSLPFPWALLTSITLIISLCFCKLCYAVSVTCNTPLPPPSTSLPFSFGVLTSITLIISLCFCKLCYAVSVTCNTPLPPPSTSLPFSFGVLTSITLIISLCFCMLRFAVNVTCRTPLLLLPGDNTGPVNFSLACLESLVAGDVWLCGCTFATGFGLQIHNIKYLIFSK